MTAFSRAFVTTAVSGTGGCIKVAPEDFRVIENPLYLPCGEGEHSYLLFEKRGITTLEAIRRIARGVGVAERDIGYAGLKDAQGVTRQTVSIPRVPPEQLLLLDLPGIVPLSARRHRNKLKLGHSAGNSFEIVVREPGEGALERARAVMDVLAERGVPNFFGEQRYGSQGNSHRIGLAWLAGDHRRAVECLIGSPDAVRDDRWKEAIAAWRRSDHEEALRLFPPHCRTEREVINRLVRFPGAWDKALTAVHPRLKMLYFSAAQSFLFDRVLMKRLADFDVVMAGDVAFKHDNGACFMVEDPAVEMARALRREISATGPLFGVRMKCPEGMPRAIEDEVLREEGLGVELFTASSQWQSQGERRPLRVPLSDPSVSSDDRGLLLRFTLPKGAYATVVLREIMKTDGSDTAVPPGGREDEAERP